LNQSLNRMVKLNKNKKKKTKKGKRSMSSTQKKHSVMADAAYNSNKKAIKRVKKKLGEDWEIDRELSTRRHKVFYNPKTKESVYSARGTKATDFKDLVSDLAIVGSRFKKSLFRRSDRMKNERKKYQRFSEKYAGYERQGTGHSLGGAVIAELTKKDPQVETTAFARGTFSNRGRYGSNLTDVANRNDLISNRVFNQKGKQKRIMIGKKSFRHKFDKLGAHAMSQFI